MRQIAQGPLAAQVEAIDRTGYYPCAELQQLAAVGAMSAHLDSTAGPADYGLAIRAMAEASRVCGATGFMMWCQAVCGLYLQQSGNPALMGDVLQRHASGAGGGTALSNPMKSYAQIESLAAQGHAGGGGYLINGTLPWVSNLGPDHYCGAIAAVVEADGGASQREVMFLLRCDAPGVEMRECPSFSAMEGTGTYALRLKDHFIGTADTMADPTRLRRPHPRGVCDAAMWHGRGHHPGRHRLMWRWRPNQGHVNQFLEDRPDALQAELDALTARVMQLAEDAVRHPYRLLHRCAGRLRPRRGAVLARRPVRPDAPGCTAATS